MQMCPFQLFLTRAPGRPALASARLGSLSCPPRDLHGIFLSSVQRNKFHREWDAEKGSGPASRWGADMQLLAQGQGGGEEGVSCFPDCTASSVPRYRDEGGAQVCTSPFLRHLQVKYLQSFLPLTS